MSAGAWNTMPDCIWDAGPLAGVIVGPGGKTVRATWAVGTRFPSWSLTSTPNTRFEFVGKRSPVFSLGVIDRNCTPGAKTVTTHFLDSLGYPVFCTVTEMSTFGFAGGVAGAVYVALNVPAEL